MARATIDEVPARTGSPPDYLWLAGSIVASYVSNNSVPAEAIGGLIEETFRTLLKLGGGQAQAGFRESSNTANAPLARAGDKFGPAVPIDKSIQRDHIVCLEDGKRLKMLKRHLRTKYGLTVEQYRAKWGLPPDYPAVAPGYTASRSAIARAIGLGKWERAGKAKRSPRRKARKSR